MHTIFTTLLGLLESGQDAVLATVASASGSTPRGAGSQMVAGPSGLACWQSGAPWFGTANSVTAGSWTPFAAGR